jgi:hypothetical protein
MIEIKSKQSQEDRFRQAAKELDCNEDEAAFRKSLGQIARAPIEKKPVKEKSSK